MCASLPTCRWEMPIDAAEDGSPCRWQGYSKRCLWEGVSYPKDDRPYGSCPSTHMPRRPAPTYLPDAFRRTGHTVVSPSILADGPPELSKCAVLLQRVGAFGSEVLVHSRIPDSAVRHLHLLGQVLECPEIKYGCETWVHGAPYGDTHKARLRLEPGVAHCPHPSLPNPSSMSPKAWNMTCQDLILSKLLFFTVD